MVSLRILIVDDDAFFRRGVREILNEAAGMQVVGEAADGEQALQTARELSSAGAAGSAPGTSGLDLVLIDVDLPRLDGLAATRRLTDEHPGLAVVLLTSTSADRDLLPAIRAGASGFLSKSLAPDALVRALRGFQLAESLPISRDAGQKLLALVRQADALEAEAVEHPLAPLTPREEAVLDLVGGGARDREIADRLIVSESTVKKHIQNILRKLRARNRAEAVLRWRSAVRPPGRGRGPSSTDRG